jgi:hypothetical protein
LDSVRKRVQLEHRVRKIAKERCKIAGFEHDTRTASKEKDSISFLHRPFSHEELEEALGDAGGIEPKSSVKSQVSVLPVAVQEAGCQDALQ